MAKEFAEAFFGPRLRSTRRLLPVFDHAGVQNRYFCRPPEWFRSPRTFAEKNQAHLEEALVLTETACRGLFADLAIDPTSIDAIYLVNSTGLATPTLDARLIHRLGLSTGIRRVPIWGLGCAGGVAGLAMACHHVTGHPRERVLLVAVELCGLTFLSGDASKANLVACALFGEGAAAALIDGDEITWPNPFASTRAPSAQALGTFDPTDAEEGKDTEGLVAGVSGLHYLGSRSTHYPDSLDVMGWHVVDEGLQVVFAQSIPAIVERESRTHVDALLKEHGIGLADIEAFLFHPGGTKVLDAYRDALDIPASTDDRLRIPVSILRDYGNMSSVTALFVLERYFQEAAARLERERDPTEPDRVPRDADGATRHFLVSALGPGFSAESVLFRA